MLLADASAGRVGLEDLMRVLGLGRDSELSVRRLQLLEVCEAALSMLTSEGDLLSYDYLVDIPAHGPWPRISGACDIHGLRIGGNPHALYARHGQCRLERWESDEDGLGRAVERIDLREHTLVMLDSNVEVRIRKKLRGEPPWRDGLDRLIGMLRGCTSDVVEVRNPVGRR